MITYFDTRRLGRMAGLTRVKDGTYYVRFTEDGTQRRKSLKTKDLKVAINRRDNYYSKLAEIGAVSTGSKEDFARLKVAQDPTDEETYIYRRKPFRVMIAKKLVGDFHTLEEAVTARNEALGVSTTRNA